MEANRIESLYERMVLIRLFEERLLDLFGEGRLFGTIHTCVGQEAIAVSVMAHLENSDVVFTGHRGHGHYLARFDDPDGLLAEIMGRQGGVSGGRGGSQHLCRAGFYTNGVQGGYLPIAVGMAFAEKRKKTGAIAVALIGDGTLGEGAVYEALNMASLWRTPLLIVLENNRYAQTTPVELNLAGTLAGRAAAFGIDCGEIESNDVTDLFPRFGKAVEQVRAFGKPRMEIVHTYRLRAHSKGDDFRPADEITAGWKKDPLKIAAQQMEPARCRAVEERVRARLAEVEKRVGAMPMATLDMARAPRSPVPAQDPCVI